MNVKTIYLAGGCFWGTEKYISSIPGVINTEVGYANGNTENPSYEDVCRRNTGHAETVKVLYDADRLSLGYLLDLYYESINPTSVNRQGGDTGAQYRTGIYYIDSGDEAVIRRSVAKLQEEYDKPIAIEINPLDNYYKAEEYHQKYLDKNPGGYCHVPASKIKEAAKAKVNPAKYMRPDKEVLKETLTKEQFEVTQNNATEPPFQNEYWNQYAQGIYVDVTTGEPLFVSTDKFESGCGWPSFAKPLDSNTIIEKADKTYGMIRTEVRSRAGDAHLGHVFTDGPKDRGGLRYCINSAALRFIPKGEMEAEGYAEYIKYLES